MDSLAILVSAYAVACTEQAVIDEADIESVTLAAARVTDAWHALEKRLAQLEGFTSGLTAHDDAMGARLHFYLTGR